MNDINNPGPGHNLALPSPEVIVLYLTETETDLTKRANNLLSAGDRVPREIKTEDENQRVADFVRQINVCMSEAEKRRLGQGAPVRAVEAAINAFFKNNVTDPLAKVKAETLRRSTVYQRQKAEEERQRREEEARLQREAERKAQEAAAAAVARVKTEADLGPAIQAERVATQAGIDAHVADRAAQAKPAELSRTRGDLGAVASLRTFWDFKDLDRDTLDLEALRQHLSVECLEKAVRSLIKTGTHELRGVVIFQNSETVVR